MKKARVIYNPVSGKELLKRNLADILQALEESGYGKCLCNDSGRGLCKNEARRVAELGLILSLPLVAMGRSMKSSMVSPDWKLDQNGDHSSRYDQ